jgi:hypothetical protein
MKPFVQALILLIFFARNSHAATNTYQTNTIEGWRVLIDQRLRTTQPAELQRALELLRPQLQEIVQKVPGPAVERLREVSLWFSPEYENIKPKAEYHPGAGWLRANKRNPDMVKGVEFTNTRIFEAETKRMPNFTLHELAHAYHDRALTNGFENPEIKAAFDRAKKSGSYENVERRFGGNRPTTKEPAYAMSSPMEYFAETSEAYFSTNDFFPFTNAALEQHDPEMHALLAKLWSGMARGK